MLSGLWGKRPKLTDPDGADSPTAPDCPTRFCCEVTRAHVSYAPCTALLPRRGQARTSVNLEMRGRAARPLAWTLRSRLSRAFGRLTSVYQRY